MKWVFVCRNMWGGLLRQPSICSDGNTEKKHQTTILCICREIWVVTMWGRDDVPHAKAPCNKQSCMRLFSSRARLRHLPGYVAVVVPTSDRYPNTHLPTRRVVTTLVKCYSMNCLRWIVRVSDNDVALFAWSARSTDLTSCDFFLRRFMKDIVFIPPLPKELKEYIIAVRMNIAR